MDHLQTRLEALEQRTQTVERQLRWWRGLAGGLLGLAVLTWALPFVTADDAKPEDKQGLEPRVAALETVLTHFHREGNEVILKGANLRIVNGLDRTDCTGAQGEPIPDCPNGLGNLIVGYNEPRGGGDDRRTGSHNVVVGERHNFSRFGGLVVGTSNEIRGDFAVVSGGQLNVASGMSSSVSGGRRNVASGNVASVSGGHLHVASGDGAAISGGQLNVASGSTAAVSGGEFNRARGLRASVGGGSGKWPAACRPRSVGGAALSKRLSSAGRRDQKAMRSWWATFAPRSLSW
jgi:hypothetical protein